MDVRLTTFEAEFFFINRLGGANVICDSSPLGEAPEARTRRALCRTYGFFSVDFAALVRSAFATTVGFETLDQAQMWPMSLWEDLEGLAGQQPYDRFHGIDRLVHRRQDGWQDRRRRTGGRRDPSHSALLRDRVRALRGPDRAVDLLPLRPRWPP